MTSGTVATLLFFLLSCSPALAQQQAQFNQVLRLEDDMTLNSFVFQDGSKVETFSQTQQQLIVNQQTPSIGANQVTGSTGNPFVALSQNSMVISTDSATDLVGGTISMAMSQQLLQAAQVDQANTYVAMLSPDRQTWMIQESVRTVNGTDMTVRMVKRQSIDGEYMLLGRQTPEFNTALSTFGDDGASQVVITGTGLQENEFQDGFRMSVRASQPMTINVNVKKGIDSSMVANLQGEQSINDFRYSVITSLAAVQPDLNQQVTVIQMPINAIRIQEMMQAAGIAANGQVALGVAQRSVLGNPGGAAGQLQGAGAAPQRRGRDSFRASLAKRQGTPVQNNNPVAAQNQLLLEPTFTPVQADLVLDTANMRVAFPVSQADGEFILTMQTGVAQPGAGQPQPAQPEQPAATAQPEQPQPEEPQPEEPQPEEPQPEEPAASASAGAEEPAATASAQPEEPQASAAAERKIKRQEATETNPEQGKVFITMREVNRMVDSMEWGGQAPITEMMTNYIKANNGTSDDA